MSYITGVAEKLEFKVVIINNALLMQSLHVVGSTTHVAINRMLLALRKNDMMIVNLVEDKSSGLSHTPKQQPVQCSAPARSCRDRVHHGTKCW